MRVAYVLAGAVAVVAARALLTGEFVALGDDHHVKGPGWPSARA